MLTLRSMISSDTWRSTGPGHPLRRLGLFAALGVLLSARAFAGEGDFFRPLVSAAYYHDSNIFRFAGDYEVPATIGGEGTGNKIRSVNYHLLGAGFLLDWQPGRQRIQTRAIANTARFSRYSAVLDYEGHDLNVRWDWQLGNRWRGRLDAERTKTLGSYDNIGVSKNTRTLSRYDLRAVRDLHSDWQAEAGYNRYSSKYSSQSSRDVDVDAFSLGVYRLGGTMQRMGVELRYSDVQRPNKIGPLSDATEWGLFGVATWQPSGKTRLRGRLGYINREYASAGARDFSGLEARLDGDWAPTGKSLVNAAVYRELNESDLGAANNYAEVTGLDLTGQWQLLPKTHIGPFLRLENRGYDGTSVDDDYYGYGLRAHYQPWSGGDIALTVERATRDSSVPNREFRATSISLTATLAF
ncbi:MAG: outer membrane beta-barrel protein [Thiobacillaceae bacterium]